jgi:hypothetical protein
MTRCSGVWIYRVDLGWRLELSRVLEWEKRHLVYEHALTSYCALNKLFQTFQRSVFVQLLVEVKFEADACVTIGRPQSTTS